MKKLASFLLKLLFSIILTFVLIEICLRLFPGVIPLELMVRFDGQPRTEIAQSQGLPTKVDTVLLERDDGGPPLRVYKPYTQIIYRIQETGTNLPMTMDENGFCNLPGSYQPATVDIITIGDSFTFCHAVPPEHSWPGQLNRLTNKSTYNLGRVGIGVHEYLQLLKAFGLQKSPQIVIMNIYAGNDLRDARQYFKHRQDEIEDDDVVDFENLDELPSASQAPSNIGFVINDLLKNYSYTVNLVVAAAEVGQDMYAEATDDPDTKAARNFRYQLIFPDGHVIPFNLDNVDRDEMHYAQRLHNREIEIDVTQVLSEGLQTFVDLAKANNFTPVVSFTPSAHITYEPFVEFENPTLNNLMPWFHQQQHDFIEEQAETLGFVFIDLTPALKEAARTNGSDNLLYYERSLHLTATGNGVVAETLSQELFALDLIEIESASN